MENKDNNIKTVVPQKGLYTDPLDMYKSNEIWLYARNTVVASSKGETPALQNQPSFIECVSLPYTYIGNISLTDQRFAIFTTDNTNSEIGIFDAKNCTYTQVVNDSCLNFSTSFLVSGKAKINADCSETIYWADSGNNSMRYLNLTSPPHTISGYTDCIPVYTTELDCNKILLYPDLSIPEINVSESIGGNLPNGVYQFGVAYSVNKERITDIFSVTNPFSIFENSGRQVNGLNVQISNLDSTFTEIELFVSYTVNKATYYKSIGFYNFSTNTETTINFSEINRPEYKSVSSSDFLIRKITYDKADWCTGNDKYLLFSGLTTKPDINYQLQAMNITAKWAEVRVDEGYYAKGGQNVGHYRDEIYAYEIEWQWDDNSYTSAFHIPGTTTIGVEPTDTPLKDIFETADSCYSDITNVETWYDNHKWAVYNTGVVTDNPNTEVFCGGTLTATGTMGYWESTLTYPANIDMFGENACQPIRHHKFPNEATSKRYIEGYIYILGVIFDNIEHPKDKDGNFIEGIKGYRILRADRHGNKSIIARGLSTNLRYYTENDGSQSGQTVAYPNYPYNDLRTDQYLSSTQTTGTTATDEVYAHVHNYTGLVNYYKDQFAFYSPACHFGHIALGNEIFFDSEEFGFPKFSFDKVYLHPKDKFPTLELITLAALAGAADSVNQGVPSLGVTAPLTFIKTADEAIATIMNFAKWEDYAYQFNSFCEFNFSSEREVGQRRRGLTYYQYLFNGLNNKEDLYINNFNRPDCVYLKLNDVMDEPAIEDTTRFLKPDAPLPGASDPSFTNTASLYYTTSKTRIPDQYGTLDSLKLLNTGYYVTDLTYPTGTTRVYTTGVVFGGDCYLNRYSVNNKMPLFRNILTDVPNGTAFDYREYRNVAYPTFWTNSSHPIGMMDILGSSLSSVAAALIGSLGGSVSASDAQGLIANRWALNNASISGTNIVRDAYFYTSVNGTFSFICESDYNLDYRQYDIQKEKADFFTQNEDLKWLYRSDRVNEAESHIYDTSYSKQNDLISSFQQPLDFSIEKAINCFQYHKNRVIYSLPANTQLKNDHWLYFLANNYYEFPLNDFGNLTSIHPIDNQQLIFFFDKSAPYTTIGRDELQTEGNIKITIGDGGLFAREPRPLEFTDYGLGHNTSRFAFKPTSFGNFYPSQKHGEVFISDNKQIKPITQGNTSWFKKYTPSFISNIPLQDNSVIGSALISGYDFKTKTYFLTKKDYYPLVDYTISGSTILYGETPISLTDTRYFKDASWTMSYKADEGYWIGWHDHHPIAYLNDTENLFSISSNSVIYKHDPYATTFCNFYGITYPHGFKIPVNDGQNISLLNTIEYQAIGQTYDEFLNTTTYLDKNYNKVIISNNEQISGELNITQPKRNSITSFLKSISYNSSTNQFDVQVNKSENKFRINDFFDITKDRGELSNTPSSLINFDQTGYKFTINQSAIDYNKSQFQRQRFRHKFSEVYFELTDSSIYKMIFNLSNFKTTYSAR